MAADPKAFIKASRERERRGFLSATPERVAKSEEPIVVVATEEHGQTIETQELKDWPLIRLYNGGSFGNLAQDDTRVLASLRREAGEKLYAHWYYGRLLRLGSRDYRKPYSGASDTFAIAPQTPREVFHRIRLREADECLGSDRTAIVTRAIVLEEKEPVQVGQIVSGRRDETAARAVAIEWLIDGLDRLRGLWGMTEKGAAR